MVPTRVIRARALVWETNPLLSKMKPECGEESGPDRLILLVGDLPPVLPSHRSRDCGLSASMSRSNRSFDLFPGKERVHGESETVLASGLDCGLSLVLDSGGGDQGHN